ncbi:MAG: hypothetical protein V3V13_01875 [Paracoccaceae bacterium]
MAERNDGKNKDAQHLAAMIAAALTIFVMVNAFDGYFDTVLRYFKARVPTELAYVATFGTYVLGGGIAYKFFKIVLTALILAAITFTIRSGSPLPVLGF